MPGSRVPGHRGSSPAPPSAIVRHVDRHAALGLYRAGFGLLAAGAIVVQLVDLSNRGTLNPANYFSYFTIQSNLIGVVVFLIGAAQWRSAGSTGFDLIRGGAVIYLTVTLVMFAVLPSGTDVDTAIPWVNTVVHEVFPVAVIVDWLLDPPGMRLTARRSLIWLVYPLAWTVYTLVRGGVVGWYPYPFLYPANGGYVTVAAYVGAILVFGAILCLISAAVANAIGGRSRAFRAVG